MMPNYTDLQDRLLAGASLDDAELAATLALLDDASPALQKAIGSAWLYYASAGLRLAITAADAGPTPRRVAAFVLGELLSQHADAAGLQALIRLVQDAEPKVRKNAAVALGRVASPQATPALLEQLQRESVSFVRPSLILALGTLGGSTVHAALREIEPVTPDEIRAMGLALEHSSATPPPSVAGDVALDTTIDLLCRPGLEPLVARALRHAGHRSRRQGAGWVRVPWAGTLDELQQLRLYEVPALPILDAPSEPLSWPEAVAEALAAAPAAALATVLTTGATVPYRVTLDLPPRARLRRRDWISALHARLSELAPQFVNTPGRYAWELRIQWRRGQWYLGLVPTTIADPRFAYRVADVPAALNPTLAAAMATLLPASPDDVVLDPFCGSATPLIERARRGPWQRLIGLDNNPAALDAARQNLAAAGLEGTTLLHDDVRQLASVLAAQGIHHVDTIITNPPYGVRTGAGTPLPALYAAALEQIGQLMRPTSRMAIMIRDSSTLRQIAARLGFSVEREFHLDSGGMDVALLLLKGPQSDSH